jgi:peptidoglycan L-alanyl-D-glutamate endopeptidase CwlK
LTLSPRSIANLAGVHRDLIDVILEAADDSPIAFAVTEGVRGNARQRELYARKLSRVRFSKHQIQSDGYGHAVDVMAVGDLDGDGDADAKDRERTWDRALYTQIAETILAVATRRGVPMKWGGTFPGFFDGVHFEMVSTAATSFDTGAMPS